MCQLLKVSEELSPAANEIFCFFVFVFYWENENQFLTGKSIFWRNVCSCVNSNYVLTCPRGCWFIAVTSVVDFDNVIGNDDFNDATFY